MNTNLAVARGWRCCDYWANKSPAVAVGDDVKVIDIASKERPTIFEGVVHEILVATPRDAFDQFWALEKEHPGALHLLGCSYDLDKFDPANPAKKNSMFAQYVKVMKAAFTGDLRNEITHIIVRLC